ncbi:hypothetical protein [Mucisphaera sp.]|uniref:hypothetical protein n=1 Tax=Mucisphaera sp. TaxID=2913024 RepID=UPI003D1272C5
MDQSTDVVRDEAAESTSASSESEALAARLVEAEATIERLERRARIDALLAETDVVDVEAARLLTEAAVAQMDDEDLELAVEDLKKHRPYLFRRKMVDAGIGVMGEETDGVDGAAAQRARASGNRRDLLAYLRLRRSR